VDRGHALWPDLGQSPGVSSPRSPRTKYFIPMYAWRICYANCIHSAQRIPVSAGQSRFSLSVWPREASPVSSYLIRSIKALHCHGCLYVCWAYMPSQSSFLSIALSHAVCITLLPTTSLCKYLRFITPPKIRPRHGKPSELLELLTIPSFHRPDSQSRISQNALSHHNLPR
jgi:hypothetical protein